MADNKNQQTNKPTNQETRRAQLFNKEIIPVVDDDGFPVIVNTTQPDGPVIEGESDYTLD